MTRISVQTLAIVAFMLLDSKRECALGMDHGNGSTPPAPFAKINQIKQAIHLKEQYIQRIEGDHDLGK